ncbi:CHAT domain-containing protein [Actinocorallia sp. API 0066]|nr:CHAT domain-containing protein [Actinocorallia sp. API 0066]
MDPDDLGPDQVPELQALLRTLAETFWDPVPWLPPEGEPLLVVPHGALLRVPFAALLTSDGERVVERHPTSVLPAAALVADLTRRAPAPDQAPSQGDEPAALARVPGVSGPGPDVGRVGVGLWGLVAPEPMPEGLPALPLLRKAFSTSVADGFPGGAVLAVGAEATREALAGVAERPPRVLCFATHAKVDGERPMDSFLALAGERLTAGEVMGMELPADVVVLAACKTGTGRIGADGVVGLARSFLLAGAGCVLMTLWRIGERDTLRVLRQFTTHLANGKTPAAALRAAQLELDHGDPRGWSSFVLFGLPD